jgi:hypothetical protein
MKLQNLIKHLGDQLQIPIEELEKFNIHNFVEESIKVASGELKALKKFSISSSNKESVKIREPVVAANFVDADEEFLNYTSGKFLLLRYNNCIFRRIRNAYGTFGQFNQSLKTKPFGSLTIDLTLFLHIFSRNKQMFFGDWALVTLR